MNKYALVIDGRGDYATWRHTNGSWSGTRNPDRMMTVEARTAKSAMNKFVKLLGIQVRYRSGDNGVIDRNLHSFHVERRVEIKARINP